MARLIINNIVFELEDVNIAQTKQVNDILSLNTRQSNFTNTFTLPLTAKNVRGFNSLGIVGNNSNVPYIKNDAYLYSDSGECYVYKGWAVINETAKGYKINVYDGSIDFYKAIENTTLNEIGISEINHTKTLDNVVGSFNDTLNYKYILADYNGKAVYGDNIINIDYLVPSVRVSWLWGKIFEYFGFTFSGSVFNTFNFTNLWMTFPKGISDNTTEDLKYESDDFLFIENESIFIGSNPTLGTQRSTYLKQNTNTLNDLDFITNDIHFRPIESGIYRLEIDALVRCVEYYKKVGFDTLYASENRRLDVWLAKNSEAISDSDNVVLLQKLYSATGVGVQDLNINSLIELDDNESYCIVLRTQNAGEYCHSVNINANSLKLSKVEADNIDFEGAFIDFKTKDFVNEILWRFALTPYKDKYSNNIEFLTLQEILQNTNVEDWTHKFNDVKSEKYIYGSYAQENIISLKYNDENAEHNDGTINIDNENLEDSKKVIASSIYSPDRDKSIVFSKLTNVYRLWNKEPKDDGTINYKSLDKRFYFLRSDNYNFGYSQKIGSEFFDSDTTIVSAPFESFYKLPFNSVIQDYYLPIYQILNNAKLNTIELFLNEIDIENLDFKKLYYFKQLGNYFLLNKVNNFTKKGFTKCEFIKVDYVPAIATTDTSFSLFLSFSDTCFTITNFEDYTNLLFQTSTDGGGTFNNAGTFITENPSCGYVNVTGLDVLFRVVNLSGEVLSNTILIPS